MTDNQEIAESAAKERDGRTLRLQTSYPDFPKLKIYIFLGRNYLRSHTVKHFFNEKEWVNAWRHYENPTYNLMAMLQVKQELSGLGGPCATMPELITGERCKNCPFFDAECLPLVREWEKSYVGILTSVIKWSINYPLFACYEEMVKTTTTGASGTIDQLPPTSHSERIRHALAMANKAPFVVVYGEFMNKKRDSCNVTTGFFPDYTSFETLSIDIKKKAIQGKVVFYTRSTWGIAEPLDDWQKKLKDMWMQGDKS